MTSQLSRPNPASDSSSPLLMSDEDFLNQITYASSLEQSGAVDEAIEVYKTILAADPNGNWGAVARRSLDLLYGSQTITRPIEEEIDPENLEDIELKTQRPLQWFYNQPIRNKQLMSLFTSEMLSLIGLVGVGTILISTGLRTQILSQAESELAVADINYNIKINQMGFGFRGQSDNAAIIEAARTSQSSPVVLNILQNEIQARTIEYATLVGRDSRIIASANADRQGALFDPNGLVSQVLENPQQIKTTEIVPWEELQRESPPLPEGFSGEDALIRYTVTPVSDPSTRQVIGALISGDIVNGKRPIVEGTVTAFGGGYSAVYVRQPSGEYELSTSLYSTDDTTEINLPLGNTKILEEAIAADGEIVTTRISLQSTPYALAARAIKNSAGQPIAVLVRGTSESGINTLIRRSLVVQALVTLLVIGVDILLAGVLTRAVARPIVALQESAKRLAGGDRSARAEIFAKDEVGQLAVTFNQMADNIATNSDRIEHQAEERQGEATFQRQEKERLQRRVMELLIEIEGARKGDLTTTAKVTDDEMGSVADAFNATVRSLRELVGQVQSTVGQVSQSASASDESVSRLSEAALAQSQSITNVLQSVEQMASSIQQVANSATEAAQIARQASASASEGGDAMELTVESIEELRNSVAETAKKVKRLTESSQEISKIVALISEVSAKTNLLAFNASIEAVRAGEHGQGFRIVADEVRRLAERVTESTKEIEQLVTGIQMETAEVLTMMEKGTEQVVTGSRLVMDTRKTLSHLTEVSQNIDELVQSISESTKSQTDVSQMINQTIKDLADVARASSSESQSVSLTLKQLVEVAGDLQNSVAQFQIDDSAKYSNAQIG